MNFPCDSWVTKRSISSPWLPRSARSHHCSMTPRRPASLWSGHCGWPATVGRGRCGSTCPSTCSPPSSTRGPCAVSTQHRMGLDASLPAEVGLTTGDALAKELRTALDHLASAERPVVLAGAGVRVSGSHEAFLRAIDKLGIPVATGWNAHDVLWNDHPLFVGRPGTVGDRAATLLFRMQTSSWSWVADSMSGRSATTGRRSHVRPTRS